METKDRAVPAGAGIRGSRAAYIARVLRVALMLPLALLWFLHHGRSARQCALEALEPRPAGSGGGDLSRAGRAGVSATPAAAYGSAAYGAAERGVRRFSGGRCGLCPIAPFCKGSGDRGAGEQE